LASRRLIVTADDAGLHPAIDRGIVEAHRKGIVTACSIVAGGASFDHAVTLLRELPALSVGVHLTFVEERPLAEAAAVPALLGGDGRFPRSYAAVARQSLLRRLRGRAAVARWLEQLRLELRLQIEKVREAGLRVDHLNSHQHLHLLPGVFEQVVELARDFGIRYVRVPRDRGGEVGLPRRVAVASLNFLGRRAARRFAGEVEFSGRTLGIAEAGRLDRERLLLLIDAVEGTSELVCHPAIDDPSLAQSYGWNYAWAAELEALCDPGVRRAIERRGIELVRPG
jgi:chitin disaccharide deacetylase